jgi:hypothetical protein
LQRQVLELQRRQWQYLAQLCVSCHAAAAGAHEQARTLLLVQLPSANSCLVCCVRLTVVCEMGSPAVQLKWGCTASTALYSTFNHEVGRKVCGAVLCTHEFTFPAGLAQCLCSQALCVEHCSFVAQVVLCCLASGSGGFCDYAGCQGVAGGMWGCWRCGQVWFARVLLVCL